MDGANMNAQVGPWARSARMSAILRSTQDLLQYPMAAAKRAWLHFASRKIWPIFRPPCGRESRWRRPDWRGVGRALGQASILVISWVYITLMGGGGLAAATRMATQRQLHRAQPRPVFSGAV